MEKCFADNSETGKCDALTVKKCEGCSFYKTEAQLTEERQTTIDSLKFLGRYTFYHDKYGV